MSLRLRLLLGLLALVAIGLSATDAVTYLALQGSLSQRANQQLVSLEDDAEHCYLSFPVAPECRALPTDSYMAVLGVGAGSGQGDVLALPHSPHPDLPPRVAALASIQPTYLTVPATDGSGEFRVLVTSLNGGGALVFAIPLSDVDATLAQLRLLEILVSGGVLLLLAAVAWWTVQLGLRPLARIRATARSIAAGDLSQRVEVADPNTEVGQLGVSLNEMLTRIESAFRAQAASESRMRQFMADASHELRTPLSSIRGYAELFRRGAKSNPADLEKTMSRIEGEAARMGEMVDDLLLLARLDEGRPLEVGPVELSQLAVDCAADQSAADRRHRITVSAAEPVTVLGDEARLRQVVTNLVRNAVVHTPAGTRVEIETRSQDAWGVVLVRDHGPGVAEEAAGRIFERFYRVDRARGRATGGAGLGLAIVSAIVAAHHGRVSLRETEGGGATFVVELPLAPADQPPAPPTPAASRARRPRNPKPAAG
ncbi:MAG: sensor histidine kinase [Candidatus Dormibacteria bacterium]